MVGPDFDNRFWQEFGNWQEFDLDSSRNNLLGYAGGQRAEVCGHAQW